MDQRRRPRGRGSGVLCRECRVKQVGLRKTTVVLLFLPRVRSDMGRSGVVRGVGLRGPWTSRQQLLALGPKGTQRTARPHTSFQLWEGIMQRGAGGRPGEPASARHWCWWPSLLFSLPFPLLACPRLGLTGHLSSLTPTLNLPSQRPEMRVSVFSFLTP